MAVRNLVNAKYLDLAKASMEKATSAAVHWDGAMYGGLNINIAIALDPVNLVGCHLKPFVPPSTIYLFCFACMPQGLGWE